jgi:deoxyribose-phosphate aldolase
MDEIRDEAALNVTEPAIPTYESLAGMLELTLLGPALTADEVNEGCRIAREYGIAAVVVRPCDVEMVSRWMRGSGAKMRAWRATHTAFQPRAPSFTRAAICCAWV